MVIACLIIGALRVRGTFYLSTTILRITEESFLAFAIRRVATCCALSIASANSATQTNILARSTSVGILYAILVNITVVVVAAKHLLGANAIVAVLEFGA